MMNVLELQDNLRNFSEDQLVNEMQQPSGNVPQYLVLSEINRRKRIRDDYQQQQQAEQSNMTVAQEKLAGAGVPEEGLAGLAAAMAPRTDITENTGATPDQTMPMPEAPAPMAELPQDGGVASMAGGGHVQRYQMGGGPAYASANPQDVLRAVASGLSSAGPQGTSAVGPAGGPGGPLGVTNRATMIDGVFVEIQPDGSVVDAATGELVSADLAQKARDRLQQSSVEAVFDPERPVSEQVASGDITMDEDQLRADSEMRELLAGGVNPSYEYSRSMQDQFGIGISDRMPFVGDGSGLTEEAPQLAISEFSARSMPTAAPTSGLPVMSIPDSLPFVAEPTPFDPLMGRLTQAEADAAQDAAQDAAYDAIDQKMDADAAAEETSAFINNRASSPPPVFQQPVRPGMEDRASTLPPVFQQPVRPGMEDGQEDAAPDSGDDLNPSMDRATAIRLMTSDDAYAYTPPSSDPDSTVDPAAPVVTRDPSGGGRMAGLAGGGEGSIESQIIDMLKEREKRAESEKWLALAQAGMALMASDQPTLGGALGEAGQVGLARLGEARDDYEGAKMSLLKTQQAMQAARARGGSGRSRGDYNTPTAIGSAISRFNELRGDLLGRGSTLVTDPLTGEQSMETVYRTYDDLSPDERKLYDSYSANIATLTQQYSGLFAADMTE